MCCERSSASLGRAFEPCFARKRDEAHLSVRSPTPTYSACSAGAASRPGGACNSFCYPKSAVFLPDPVAHIVFAIILVQTPIPAVVDNRVRLKVVVAFAAQPF